MSEQDGTQHLTDKVSDHAVGWKKRVGVVLEHKAMEFFIMLLVFVDIGLLGTESMLDAGVLCLGGRTIYGEPVIAGTGGHSAMQYAEKVTAEHPAFIDGGTFFVIPRRYSTELRQFNAPAASSEPHIDLTRGGGAPAHGAPTNGASGHGGSAHGLHATRICQAKHGPQVVAIEHFCHTASITILSIFLFEIFLKICIGPSHFFHNPFEVLDLVVVSLSLFADVFILPMVHDPSNKSNVEILMSLLMLCRIWRVVRIGHGIAEVGKKAYRHEKDLINRSKALETENTQLREQMLRNGIKPEAPEATRASSPHHSH